MKMRFALSVFVIVALLAPALAHAGEKIDNPVYKHWSKFKVGTSNTSEGDGAGAMGAKMHFKNVTTLKEVTPETLTLSTTTNVTFNGHEAPPQTHERTVAAQVDSDSKKDKVVSEGKETVEAMGKSIECDVFTVQVENEHGTADMKIWVNPEIPGTVKMNATMKSPRGEITYSVVVKSVDIK